MDWIQLSQDRVYW